MLRAINHPISGLFKLGSVATAVLVAGIAVSSSARAETPKAHKSPQATVTTATSEQCTAPSPIEHLVLQLDPFVSYPWVPAAAFDSEIRYINHLNREIEGAPYLPILDWQSAVLPASDNLSPDVSLVDQPDRYVIRVRGAGVTPPDVKVDVKGQQVTIRYDKDETIRNAAATPSVERFDSHFAESLQVGSPVQAGRIEVTPQKEGVDVVLLKAHR